MVAVKGHVQVADVVDWGVADHSSTLKAGQISGARSLRVLAGSLSVQMIGFSKDRIRLRESTTSILDLSPDRR